MHEVIDTHHAYRVSDRVFVNVAPAHVSIVVGPPSDPLDPGRPAGVDDARELAAELGANLDETVLGSVTQYDAELGLWRPPARLIVAVRRTPGAPVTIAPHMSARGRSYVTRAGALIGRPPGHTGLATATVTTFDRVSEGLQTWRERLRHELEKRASYPAEAGS